MPLTSIAELNGPQEEVARRINQAKRLSALYDDFINMMQDGHDRAPGIHASELYPCMRQAVYSCGGEPRQPKVTKFWKQRFKMGQRIHLMLQDDFEEMAKASVTHDMFQYAQRVAEDMDCRIEFDAEVKVKPELQPIAAYWNIHSACDGIFRFYDRNTNELVLRVGLEIKTEAPAGYEALKAPKPEHLRQAHLYMGCLDIPVLWFLYMNKGNQNNTNSQAPYLVVYQPAIWAELEARFRDVHDHVQRRELPPRVEGIYCEFCAWAYTCKPDNSRVHSQGNYQPRVNVRAPGQV